MPLFILILSNLAVGVALGATGIGGFLLPVLLTGLAGFAVREALSLSFISFTVSGTAGALIYWKSASLDLRKAILISIGSIPGAAAGVAANTAVSSRAAAAVLYGSILAASLYTLLKKKRVSYEKDNEKKRRLSFVLLFCIGFFTAAVCAFVGAGGPILVIPILALLEIDPKESIGIALFNSVFVGLTAAFGYTLALDAGFLQYGLAAAVSVTLGVAVGSRLFKDVNPLHVGRFVAAAAGLSALFLLLRLFFW